MLAPASERARELQGRVAAEKAAIRRHRARLKEAARMLRAEYARIGINFTVAGEEEEEIPHGRDEAERTCP